MLDWAALLKHWQGWVLQKIHSHLQWFTPSRSAAEVTVLFGNCWDYSLVQSLYVFSSAKGHRT